MKLYVIVLDRDEADSYWNNDSGWGCLETADVFNQEERDELNLPMEGRWVELPQRRV